MSAMRLVFAVDVGDLAETSIDPWSAVLAVVVLIVAWILSRITRKSTARVLTRLEGISDEMRAFIARIAGYVVIFLGVGVALALLGAAIQPLITVAIVFGVILALALRGIADNFASGIVLQTRRPIHIGDEVESLGYVGNVLDMDSRAVVIETFDGRTVHLPNSEVLGDPLINHSTKGARRSEVEVRVRSKDVEGTGQRLIATVARCLRGSPRTKASGLPDRDRPCAGDGTRLLLASTGRRSHSSDGCDPGISRSGAGAHGDGNDRRPPTSGAAHTVAMDLISTSTTQIRCGALRIGRWPI